MTLADNQSRVEYTLPQAVVSPYLMIETVSYHPGGSELNWVIDKFEVLSTNTVADTIRWNNRILAPVGTVGAVYTGSASELTNRLFWSLGVAWADESWRPTPGFTATLNPADGIERLGFSWGISAHEIGYPVFSEFDSPKDVRVIFDTRITNSFTFADSTHYAVVELPQTVFASSMTVLVDSIYDHGWNDLIYLHEAEAFIPEPGAMLLVLVAAGMLGLRSRRA